jgi:Reverse transcriptase (RNA-dependent DNA polymerase)
LVLALASICGFEVWTLDISQAFLQAAHENMRDIFLQPPIEMKLSSDEFLKLMKPLYGFCDSGDWWYHTLRHHHVQDLQMEPLDADTSLYFRSIGNRLIGLSGVYVDYMLRCGTPDFFGTRKRLLRFLTQLRGR